MGTPRHGRNGLIYISGIELAGSNAWSIKIDVDTSEAGTFGDQWKNQLIGLLGWSGSVNAWDHVDSKLLADAAISGTPLPLVIYPLRTELTDYYSGNAIFGMSSAGGMGGGITKDGDYTGDGTLTIAGFAV